MHILHPQFTPDKIAISIYQASLAETNRFDFRSRQHYPGRISLNEFVIE